MQKLNNDVGPQGDEDENDEDEDELNEFELMAANSVQRDPSVKSRRSSILKTLPSKSEEDNGQHGQSITEALSEVHINADAVQSIETCDYEQPEAELITSCEYEQPEAKSDIIWKRTTELPEQNVSIKVKGKKTLKQEIIDNKEKVQQMTFRLFDDRLFITNENTHPGEELALNTLIGFNKEKNPVVAKMAGMNLL